MKRRCEWCGCFVGRSQPETVWHCYECADPEADRVYGSSTATRLISRLLCKACAPVVRDWMLVEDNRDYEIVISKGGNWRRISKVAS